MDNKLAIAILMGGRSRRMGRRKDTIVLENGETFLQRICRECETYNEKYISINISQHDIDTFASEKGFFVVEDEYEDIGPMGGILSILKKIRSEAVLVIAVDMINVKKEHIDRMLLNYDGEKALVSISGNGSEPLFSVFSKKCIPEISFQISKGEYSLRKYISETEYKSVLWENDDIFENINSLETNGTIQLI